MNTSNPLLEGRQLECIRGERLLFRELDLRVDPGRVLLLEGPNGSGKTSLLRILAGLSLPETGDVLWQGRPVSADPAAYRSGLAYLGHLSPLKLDLSARENLRFLMRLHGSGRICPDEALERVGLADRAQLECRKLSAGQRRRVALARLLVAPARLWLLDEPYTALDTNGIALLEALLSEHLDGHGAAVISSHQRPGARLPLDILRLGNG